MFIRLKLNIFMMGNTVRDFGTVLRKFCVIKCKTHCHHGLYKQFSHIGPLVSNLGQLHSNGPINFSGKIYLRYFHQCLAPPHIQTSCVVSSMRRRALQTHSPRGFPKGWVQTEADPKDPDAIALARQDIDALFREIRKELGSRDVMREIATYYFDGRGKSIRPLITLLMARAINSQLNLDHPLLGSQREIAKIVEMVHASSLLHDDVIDCSDTRRGQPAVHSLYSHRRAVMVGDFVLSVASTMAARLRHEGVLVLLSQVLVDLVEGEFMQLGSKEKEDERFNHYLKKTFNKTASLIAFSCKAVALLAGASEEVQEIAFQYGKNSFIAFQLIDDLLDFSSTSKSLGKPNLNDLKSGLATAPILFACEKFPELNAMIMRRFREPEDVEKALDYVLKSDGLEQTKFLAQKHCQEAVRQIGCLKRSPEQRGLMLITDDILNRSK